MTADTFSFLLTAALVAAVIVGWLRQRKRKKEKIFYQSNPEGWYDPTYYYH